MWYNLLTIKYKLTEKEPGIINGDLPEKMAIFEIKSYLRAIEENSLLYKEKNFDKRIEVIDFIGFQVIDQKKGVG